MQILSGFFVFYPQRLPIIDQSFGYQFGYQQFVIILGNRMTDFLAFKFFSLTTNEQQKGKVSLTLLFHFKGHHHEHCTNIYDPVLDQKKPR